MNQLLPARFVERVYRLMLGIEPLDALSGLRIAQRIDVVLDGSPAAPAPVGAAVNPQAGWDSVFGLPDAIGSLAQIARHDSCRFALVWRPGMTSPLAVRLFDRQRRYAPRRIRWPVPADIHDASGRLRRPALYPGAAYTVGTAVTGMRGRVTWNQPAAGEVPARWVRVQASIDGTVVGTAHGDERGEFLLLLDNVAGGLGDLPSPLTALVTVFGPAGPQAPVPGDPLADLPLETLLADPDDVSPGTRLPPGYAATALSSRNVDFVAGLLLTQQPKFFFQP